MSDAFVGEFEVADNLMVKVFQAGAVGAHVVCAPPAAEIFAARGQFVDEVVHKVVERVAAGFGAQD
jgi:hypothetical protein